MKEAVQHPRHYGGEDDPFEAIKVIEAWGCGFNTGNVLKYIRRGSAKGGLVQNLKKARWYLDREIQKLESNTALSIVTETQERSVDSEPAIAPDPARWIGGTDTEDDERREF